MATRSIDPDSLKKAAKKPWVQTDREVHEAWSELISSSPTAARLAHILVANMDNHNAVVASQATIGELMAMQGQKPVHRHTIRKAIQKLVEGKWIEVRQIGGKGGALAYIINDRVAWDRPRDQLRHSTFSANVILSSSEQLDEGTFDEPLRKIRQVVKV